MAEGTRTESEIPQGSFPNSSSFLDEADEDQVSPPAAGTNSGSSSTPSDSGADKPSATTGRRGKRAPAAAASAPSTSGINWTQGAALVHFAARYASASPEARRFALEIFSLQPQNGSPTATATKATAGSEAQRAALVAEESLDLARRLSPAGGLIVAWRIYDSLVEQVAAGPLGWEVGINYTGQLSDADPSVLREFVRIVNVCSASEVSVGKRVGAVSEIVSACFSAVIAAKDLHSGDDRTFVNDLLALWS